MTMEASQLESRLSPERARELIATRKAQALDIRDDAEWNDKHIAGTAHAKEEEIESRLDELSKEEPVIVICEEGERSGRVAAELRERGYEAASVEGGIKGWEQSNMPLLPASDFEFEGPGDKPPGV